MRSLISVKNQYFYFAPVGKRSIAISLSVCLSVCQSVREHISGTAGPIFAKCFMFYVAQSSSGGTAIRYALPVLWMTSSLAVVRRMAMRGRVNF